MPMRPPLRNGGRTGGTRVAPSCVRVAPGPGLCNRTGSHVTHTLAAGREAWSALVVLRPRLTHARRAAEVVLVREEHRTHARIARRELREVVVADLDEEPRRVEWVDEAQRHRRLVADDLLAQHDVR